MTLAVAERRICLKRTKAERRADGVNVTRSCMKQQATNECQLSDIQCLQFMVQVTSSNVKKMNAYDAYGCSEFQQPQKNRPMAPCFAAAVPQPTPLPAVPAASPASAESSQASRHMRLPRRRGALGQYKGFLEHWKLGRRPKRKSWRQTWQISKNIEKLLLF